MRKLLLFVVAAKYVHMQVPPMLMCVGVGVLCSSLLCPVSECFALDVGSNFSKVITLQINPTYRHYQTNFTTNTTSINLL
jgi:hypothetical protein